MKSKLSIMVPNDSVIDHYLYEHPSFTMTQNSPESVVYVYDGYFQPLAEISVLLSKFEPQQYTISKSMTGFLFVVLPLY